MVKMYYVSSQTIFPANSEVYFSSFREEISVSYPQKHDFYEITLVTNGSILFNINGKKQQFNKGALLLIRPQDLHEKKAYSGSSHINMAFLGEVLFSLFDYLGDSLRIESLLECADTPVTFLSKPEYAIISKKIERLHMLAALNHESVNMELRKLLFDIFTQYFSTVEVSRFVGFPTWLENTIVQMNNRDNFSKGISALIEISGRSHSQLCHEFKKYFQVTPTSFVNELRINFAANLLIYTNIDILSIALEAGFNNLSHFYHLFYKKRGMSPGRYRKEAARQQ